MTQRKVFIISGGRTGTTFLGEKLGEVFPGCLAVHEPDSVHLRELRNPLKLLHKIRTRGGALHLLIRKIGGSAGTRNIALLRLQGRISRQEAIRRLERERSWAANLGNRIYVEANHQLHGLVEDLPSVPSAEVILITRHPFSWISSWLNYKYSLYGERDLLHRIDTLGMKRFAPKHVGEDCPEWESFSQIQRLTWLWNNIHTRFAAVVSSGYPNLALFRFEDLFEMKSESTLRRFATAIDPDSNAESAARGLMRLLLEEKLNSSSAVSAPAQRNLTIKERGMIRGTCDSVMKQLGYG